eukprot:5658433-Prymnesium_polylepis.2
MATFVQSSSPMRLTFTTASTVLIGMVVNGRLAAMKDHHRVSGAGLSVGGSETLAASPATVDPRCSPSSEWFRGTPWQTCPGPPLTPPWTRRTCTRRSARVGAMLLLECVDWRDRILDVAYDYRVADPKALVRIGVTHAASTASDDEPLLSQRPCRNVRGR